MIRLVPRLDIKGEYLIKGIHLEGLRKIGNPQDFAQKYYQQGADELIYMDAVASLYGRNSLTNIIKETVKSVFIPITVGGGIRSIDDAKNVLRSGADKVAINTAATQNPQLINQMSRKFGSQSIVLSIEAKQKSSSEWEVYTDNGREKTGLNVRDWAIEAAERGAGEILLTSIDNEGTKQGFDTSLLNSIRRAVSIPVIISGGMGKIDDAVQAINLGANAIAIADILHYEKMSLNQVRDELSAQKIAVRSIRGAV